MGDAHMIFFSVLIDMGKKAMLLLLLFLLTWGLMHNYHNLLTLVINICYVPLKSLLVSIGIFCLMSLCCRKPDLVPPVISHQQT